MYTVVADGERLGVGVLDLTSHRPDKCSVGCVCEVQRAKFGSIATGEPRAGAIAVPSILSEAPQIETKRINVRTLEWIMTVQDCPTLYPIEGSRVVLVEDGTWREFAGVV